MPESDKFKHIQVYCPECQRMISPGEYSLCPYFEGGESDLSEEERVFKQLFNCHVKCGTKIEYHYYKDGKRVTTTVDPVENEGMLMEILKRVINRK
jgi:hypothetical protein